MADDYDDDFLSSSDDEVLSIKLAKGSSDRHGQGSSGSRGVQVESNLTSTTSTSTSSATASSSSTTSTTSSSAPPTEQHENAGIPVPGCHCELSITVTQMVAEDSRDKYTTSNSQSLGSEPVVDMIAVVYEQTDDQTGPFPGWQEFDRTMSVRERKMLSTVSFPKNFLFPYPYDTRLKIALYESFDDTGLMKQQNEFGSVETTLADIVANPGNTAMTKLESTNDEGRHRTCRIILKAKYVGQLVTLRLSAVSLDKKDRFGLSDPFVEAFYVHPQRGLQPAFNTDVVIASLDPVWQPVTLSMARLCRHHPTHKLLVRVFDWDGSGDFDFIGECRTTVHAILEEGVREWKLIEPSLSGRTGYTHSGVLHLDAIELQDGPPGFVEAYTAEDEDEDEDAEADRNNASSASAEDEEPYDPFDPYLHDPPLPEFDELRSIVREWAREDKAKEAEQAQLKEDELPRIHLPLMGTLHHSSGRKHKRHHHHHQHRHAHTHTHGRSPRKAGTHPGRLSSSLITPYAGKEQPVVEVSSERSRLSGLWRDAAMKVAANSPRSKELPPTPSSNASKQWEETLGSIIVEMNKVHQREKALKRTMHGVRAISRMQAVGSLLGASPTGAKRPLQPAMSTESAHSHTSGTQSPKTPHKPLSPRSPQTPRTNASGGHRRARNKAQLDTGSSTLKRRQKKREKGERLSKRDLEAEARSSAMAELRRTQADKSQNPKLTKSRNDLFRPWTRSRIYAAFETGDGKTPQQQIEMAMQQQRVDSGMTARRVKEQRAKRAAERRKQQRKREIEERRQRLANTFGGTR